MLYEKVKGLLNLIITNLYIKNAKTIRPKLASWGKMWYNGSDNKYLSEVEVSV